jgi:hypothetical protein
MSVIPYHDQLFAIDYITKVLIYKDIINYKAHNQNKEFKCTLFNLLHSDNFIRARTAALLDVTVKDNKIATDCSKDDC